MACATVGYTPAVSYAREWELFAQDRDFKEDQLFLEWMRQENAEGDAVDIFWKDSESSPSSFHIEVVRKFCQGVSLNDLNSGAGRGERRAAWLDDRCAHRTGKPNATGFSYRFFKAMVGTAWNLDNNLSKCY